MVNMLRVCTQNNNFEFNLLLVTRVDSWSEYWSIDVFRNYQNPKKL